MSAYRVSTNMTMIGNLFTAYEGTESKKNTTFRVFQSVTCRLPLTQYLDPKEHPFANANFCEEVVE